jgi:chromosome segregation ATPase
MTTDTAAERRDTIKRAVDLIDSASPEDVKRWLAHTNIRDEMKADPGRFRSALDTDLHEDDGIPLFSRWRAALQFLHAADPANDLAAMQAELAEAEAELDAIAEESRAAYRRWQELDRQLTAKAHEVRELRCKIRLA